MLRARSLSSQRPHPGWRAADGESSLPTKWRAIRAIISSAIIKQGMINAGVPGGRAGLGVMKSAARAMLHAVSIRSNYPGPCGPGYNPPSRLCGASAYASKYIVCDDDVDVTSLDHNVVGDAFAHGSKQSIQFLEGSWDSPADPAIPPERRKAGDITHSVALMQRLQTVALARSISAQQYTDLGRGSQGAREIRLAARWDTSNNATFRSGLSSTIKIREEQMTSKASKPQSR